MNFDAIDDDDNQGQGNTGGHGTNQGYQGGYQGGYHDYQGGLRRANEFGKQGGYIFNRLQQRGQT